MMARFNNAVIPLWLTDQASGTAGGLLGSEAVTLKLPPDPESTDWLAMGLTIGGRAALTATVLVAVAVPQALVTVSERFVVVPTAV